MTEGSWWAKGHQGLTGSVPRHHPPTCSGLHMCLKFCVSALRLSRSYKQEGDYCASGFSWSYSCYFKKLRDPQERDKTIAVASASSWHGNITLLWRAQTLRGMSIRAVLGSVSLSMVVLGGTERVAGTFAQPYLCLPRYKEHSKIS